MSIVSMLAAARSAANAATTARATNPSDNLIAAAILIGIGSAIALAAGAFREHSIAGPVRIAPDKPIAALLWVTLIGGGAWFFAQVAYVGMRATQFKIDHPGATFSTDQLGARDFAILSVLPSAAGLMLIIAGDAMGKLARKIGYSLAQLPRGVIGGIVSALAILPIVYGSSSLVELFYQVMHVKHPAEHELLGAMKEASHQVQILLIFGACVAAPVFEEMLFRGHIQTLFVRLFAPAPRPVLAVVPVDVAQPIDVSVDNAPANPLTVEPISPDLEMTSARAARIHWMAVLCTSIIFALIHPLWMSPIIFVLSLCLGYAYERTGNLWTSILIHAAFNSVSTVAFLNLR
jgi:membrane protease YdiL (CAAX protease family)